MNPAVIQGHAHVAGQPDNWDESVMGRCQGLPIRFDAVAGLTFMRSAWTPTDEEIAHLVAGANVELGVSAPEHPVVQLGVGPVPHDPELPARPVYIVRDMIDADGSRWCRAIVVLGSRSFPAGIQIKEDVPFEIASARLIKALQSHMAAAGITS